MLRYALPLLLLTLAMGCGGGSNPPTYPPPPPSAEVNPPTQGAKAQRPAPPKPSEEKQITPQERLDQNMAELTKRLVLKPQQVAPVREILAQEQARLGDLRSQQASTTSVNTMIRLFEMQHLVEKETQTALAKVLTKDQLEAYGDWLKEERKRLGAMGAKDKGKGATPRRGGGGPGGPGGPGGRI
ncbi:MAG: hypothetical protein K9K66_01555 [Desulfarculaceae bacterium]|nr:hypothetical protein [Desulfarculaceae bacterium]MCF8072400.1 hypothetical protein [Desulfarculaceae bacterium]MCF8100321.1 hypothetical protein [Desulfarculaceae bacterium]MCF8117912.1 hypothetical protein [Desulfarculaceae bacterium]